MLYINGKPQEVPLDSLITYETIIDLAGFHGTPFVTYEIRKGPSGFLTVGQSIVAVEGMIINVANC